MSFPQVAEKLVENLYINKWLKKYRWVFDKFFKCLAKWCRMHDNVRGCVSLSPPATKSQADLWQVSKWHKDPWQFSKPLKAPLSPFKTLQVSSHAQQPWRGFQGLLGPSKSLRATPSTPQGTSGQFGNRHRGLDRPRKMPYNMGVRKTRFFKNLENLKIWFF